VARQEHILIEYKVRRHKCHVVLSEEQECATLTDAFDETMNRRGINFVRLLSHQSEQDSAVSAMAKAGVGERPNKFDVDARHLL
jgi:hypothetical protein